MIYLALLEFLLLRHKEKLQRSIGQQYLNMVLVQFIIFTAHQVVTVVRELMQVTALQGLHLLQLGQEAAMVITVIINITLVQLLLAIQVPVVHILNHQMQHGSSQLLQAL